MNLSIPPQELERYLEENSFLYFRELDIHSRCLYILINVHVKLLQQYYDHLIAGHMGYSRMKEFITRQFFWSGMSSTIKEYVYSYPVCQRIKAPRNCPF